MKDWIGPEPKVPTQFNAPDPARHPDYRFVPVPDGSPVPVAIEDVVAQILELGVACESAFRDRLASVLEEYSRDAVACLVADTHLLPIFEVAARLSVPTLALRTGSAACCACFLAYPMLCKKGYLPVQGRSCCFWVTQHAFSPPVLESTNNVLAFRRCRFAA